ncbi:hypothetical protein BDU57DRAFT_306073 [Ampelomyces quisqualis]|uniref:Uncharacterized protein n=1 Tax=Ampelomyces quisqualis TaxID=50730 RepID=A0A6A5QHN9_AMPQU|nr:hypothetical protein BDU57DRAFT_306073 [Ampelomyces quisqualis]
MAVAAAEGPVVSRAALGASCIPTQSHCVVAGDDARPLRQLRRWTKAVEAENGGAGRCSVELRHGKLYSSALHGWRPCPPPPSESLKTYAGTNMKPRNLFRLVR